jgi:hypothetical protein
MNQFTLKTKITESTSTLGQTTISFHSETWVAGETVLIKEPHSILDRTTSLTSNLCALAAQNQLGHPLHKIMQLIPPVLGVDNLLDVIPYLA